MDDFGIVVDVGCRRCVLCQCIQIDQFVYFFGFVVGGYGFIDGNDVGWFGVVDEFDDVFEDDVVIVVIEIFSVDEVGDMVLGCVVQQQVVQY